MGVRFRLIWVAALMVFVGAAVYAGDQVQTSAPVGPPKAEMRPVTEESAWDEDC